MAAIAAADGIKAIIATPHTDGIRVNREVVRKAVQILNSSLQQNKLDIKIYSGYEIPSYLLSELGRTYSLAESSYILLEFPHTHLPSDAVITVSSAISGGLRPIIAHPERNPDIAACPELLNELVDAGAMVQLTASSLTGEQGLDIQLCAYHLLKNKLAHFIATDSHSPSFRKPVLSIARSIAEKIVGREQTVKLFEQNAASIIQHIDITVK
jgi:protein-tyrosine phosphatase